MKKVLGIYGAGGLGRELLELATIINKSEHKWDAFVFIVDKVDEKRVNDIDVLDYSQAKAEYPELEVIMGIGEPSIRETKFKQLSQDGITVPTLIHPNVYIPKTTIIGKGVVIQEGCFVSCNVTINDYVFIQPNANIGHDDVLKTGCIISGMANLSGHVTIGEYSYIGISAAIKQGVSIGDYCIIGMCSGVYNNIDNEMIAMGNPARPMKKNEEHKVFK